MLLTLLKEYFKNHPDQKQKILKAMETHWQRGSRGGLVSRAFDPLQLNFIYLMPQPLLLNLIKDLIGFLNSPDFKDESLKPMNCEIIQKWAQKIIDYAYKSLIEDGVLNKKLLQMLHWDKYAPASIYDPSETINLTCSLVAVLFQQVTYNSLLQLYMLQDSYINVIGYINNHYSKWVKDYFKEHQVNHFDSAQLEVSAVTLSKKIKNKSHTQSLNDFYDQLLFLNKMNTALTHALWLETMMQNLADKKLFSDMWEVFLKRFQHQSDYFILKEPQQDQYKICKKRYMYLQLSSTHKIFTKLPHLPEAKPIFITVGEKGMFSHLNHFEMEALDNKDAKLEGYTFVEDYFEDKKFRI